MWYKRWHAQLYGKKTHQYPFLMVTMWFYVIDFHYIETNCVNGFQLFIHGVNWESNLILLQYLVCHISLASLPKCPWASAGVSPQPRPEVRLCLCLSGAHRLQELLQACDKKRMGGLYHWASIHSVLIPAPGFPLCLSLGQATLWGRKRSIISQRERPLARGGLKVLGA